MNARNIEHVIVAGLFLIWLVFSSLRDLKSKKTSAGWRGRHVLDQTLYMVDRSKEPIWYWLLILIKFGVAVYLIFYILQTLTLI
jgi:hypothetical protein